MQHDSLIQAHYLVHKKSEWAIIWSTMLFDVLKCNFAVVLFVWQLPQTQTNSEGSYIKVDALQHSQCQI